MGYFSDEPEGISVSPHELWVFILLVLSVFTVACLHRRTIYEIPVGICLMACLLTEAHVWIRGIPIHNRETAILCWSCAMSVIILAFRVQRKLVFNEWLARPGDLDRLRTLLLPKNVVEVRQSTFSLFFPLLYCCT